MTIIYGYARTAVDEDTLADQRSALQAAGCTQIFVDEGVAEDDEKEQLLAVLRSLSAGDTLIVTEGSRLGSTWPLRLPAIAAVRKREAHFRPLRRDEVSSFDTTQMKGRMMVDAVISARKIQPLVAAEPVAAPPAFEEVADPAAGEAPHDLRAPYSGDWIDSPGLDLEDSGYCITVIKGISPAAALRRLGATEIETTTLAALNDLAETKTLASGPVVAFGASGHAVLVEDNGYRAVDMPELSRGTTAASAYLSINADSRMVISRDGVVLLDWDGDDPSPSEGEEPELLHEVLAAMEYDEDDEEYLDQLEAVCRYMGVRPTVEQVTGPMLGAAVPMYPM